MPSNPSDLREAARQLHAQYSDAARRERGAFRLRGVERGLTAMASSARTGRPPTSGQLIAVRDNVEMVRRDLA